MKGLELTLYYIAAMLVLTVATVLPLVGYIVLILDLLSFGFFVYLIGFLFNAMLVHLAAAAWLRRIERGWALVPAIVYAGFALHALHGYLAASAMKTHIEAQAGVEAPPVTPRAVQVIEGGISIGYGIPSGLAGIVKGVAVYDDDNRVELRPVRPPGCEAHVGPDEIMTRYFSNDLRVAPSALDSSYIYCFVSHREAPRDEVVFVSLVEPERAHVYDDLHKLPSPLGFMDFHSDGFTPAAKHFDARYTFTGADGEIGHAESGRIAYPFPLPIPYLGCSAGDFTGWACGFGLVTLSMPYGMAPGFGPEDVTAEAGYIAGLLHLPLRNGLPLR